LRVLKRIKIDGNIEYNNMKSISDYTTNLFIDNDEAVIHKLFIVISSEILINLSKYLPDILHPSLLPLIKIVEIKSQTCIMSLIKAVQSTTDEMNSIINKDKDAVLEEFFDKDKRTVGATNVLLAAEMGAVNTLIISETVDLHYLAITDSKGTWYHNCIITSVEEKSNYFIYEDAVTKEPYIIQTQTPLIDYFCQNEKNYALVVVIVSDKTALGKKFLTECEGVAATLRFNIDIA